MVGKVYNMAGKPKGAYYGRQKRAKFRQRDRRYAGGFPPMVHRRRPQDGYGARVYTPYYLGKGGSWGMWGGVVVQANISKKIDLLCESWVELLTRARFFAKRHKEILKGTSVGVAYKF